MLHMRNKKITWWPISLVKRKIPTLTRLELDENTTLICAYLRKWQKRRFQYLCEALFYMKLNLILLPFKKLKNEFDAFCARYFASNINIKKENITTWKYLNHRKSISFKKIPRIFSDCFVHLHILFKRTHIFCY